MDRVGRAEQTRVDLIQRIIPSAVCIYDIAHRSGGSGVLVNPEGYGLTNYHVVAGMLERRRGWGGLGDGVLYELEVLGVDVTGDVAMFRLLPPEGWRDLPEQDEGGAKGVYRFPYAKLGDSDSVRVGDPVIVLGNPFSLSEDYTPSVTQGMITGTHRYQEGSRGNLVYTDCLQTDASINPGNSGGPLFNMNGEVIGINGRISVNTRGRFNVGFGYAISSNQIERFVPTLRAGLLARHGTWQARVKDTDDGVVFSEIARSGAAYEAGLRVGQKLMAFDGTPITSANQVMSLLGTYPVDWPVALEVEQEGATVAVVVRLDPVEPTLRHPFIVDAEVNAEAVRRVLRGFRQSVLSGASELADIRKWRVARSHLPDAGGIASSSEFFDVSVTEGRSALMIERMEDGTAARVIKYDRVGASQRIELGEEFFDLPADEAMVLAALFVLQHDMLSDDGDLDVSSAAHSGADWHLPLTRAQSSQDLLSLPLTQGQENAEGRLLEVIQWPLSADVTARFAFDSRTFAVRFITVEDRSTGGKADIELSNWCDLGDMFWPCTIRVQADGFAYEDDLSAWEPSP